MLSNYTIKEVGSREKKSIGINELVVRFGDSINLEVLQMSFVTGCSVSSNSGEVIADIEKGK